MFFTISSFDGFSKPLSAGCLMIEMGVGIEGYLRHIVIFGIRLYFLKLDYIMKRFLPFLFLGFSWTLAFSQQVPVEWRTPLAETALEAGFQASDLADIEVTDHYLSKKSGVYHVYIQQQWQGIDIYWAIADLHFNRSGEVFHHNLPLHDRLAERVRTGARVLSAEDAILRLAAARKLPQPSNLVSVLERGDAEMYREFSTGGLTLQPVSTRLVYFPVEDMLHLAWEVQWYEKSGEHHWLGMVDAETGALLFEHDQVIHCDFGPGEHSECDHLHYDGRDGGTLRHSHSQFTADNLTGGTYRVFPVPVESPNHGDQALVTDPSDPVASPFGWHDDDGVAGAEYTITRGNNVHAYADIDNSNVSQGDEPDGGVDLLFDYLYDQAAGPEAYRDAAVVNLFYWCNIVHDVFYQYGFDEPAGNFQENNYGNGGLDGDLIVAQAQDGGGTNNANFSSGADGTNARIQMYLWTSSPAEELLTIDSPASVADDYFAVEAGFGPGLSSDPLTGDLILVDDGSVSPTLGCSPYVNASEVNGNIALIDRGDCSFVEKVTAAQSAGAIAAIVCNNVGGAPIAMGGAGGGAINIPSVMISQADCNLFKAELDAGNVVTGTLEAGDAGTDLLDGDFDSGIIAHEYGHGVSIRLTGGPSTGGCLGNAEQMGEGWSDWIGLMLTMEPGDTGADIRGIGTFAIGQPTTGTGIRPAPYSTDFAINDYTYGATNNTNLSQPHGIGFVWSTMIWDLTWALIDVYGWDEDFYNGTGGNNIALDLVTEGMKLQGCTPGFVAGRDGILAADEALFDGAHQCLIWEVFANRGLGFSASQGSPFNRSDQTEAFDVPPLCLTPVAPPTADFLVDADVNCTGIFTFSDNSSDIPQFYSWDFGDGNTSDMPNPIHTYAEGGTYTVTLVVSNTLGEDTTSLTVVYEEPNPPVVPGITICQGEDAVLVGTSDGTIRWELLGFPVGSGDTLTLGNLNFSTTVKAYARIGAPIQNVGPQDPNAAPGGYHNTGFLGTVQFTAEEPFTLLSALVDAGDAGDRTIQLFDENGTVIDEVTVFMEQGQSVVELNLFVPAPGDYEVGGASLNLFRNNAGVEYPFVLDNVVTITGSSSTQPGFYYYLYDWEVEPLGCESDKIDVEIDVIAPPMAEFTFETDNQNVQFEDLSTGADSWFWDFGDGTTSTEQNPEHSFPGSGEYLVTLTVTNAGCSVSYQQEVSIISSVIGVGETVEQFVLLPSIGNGTFEVAAQLKETQPVQLEVYNALGQMVYQLEPGRVNRIEETIQLEGAAGVYLVTLRVDGQSWVKRYVLMD
jgi:extracellular elastinolytic metalloproteinase